METLKLYYENCHRREFISTVTSCREAKEGFWVTLNATAFYPEGGGQDYDTGILGTARVLAVREEEGIVLHLCDSPLAVDTIVEGRVDWEKRFDLMQQHTGEHIVSGIIHKMFGSHNVGFHMGSDVVTIDFDAPIPLEILPEIERQANEAVFLNLPVLCSYPSPEELPQVQYRTKKALPWPVRIVEIPGFDTCACCGVHVANTGEIGYIKILSCIKFHEGVRMEMICGGRAVTYMGKIFEQNRLVSQAFSAKLLETGSAAQRMNETFSEEKFRAVSLERRLFDAIARSFRDKGDVVYFGEALDSATVRQLADKIADSCGGTAAVFSGKDGEGYSFALVNKSGDVKALGLSLNEALSGRGGGKPGFFQGSVKATRNEIKAFFNK
ncbi:MAG: alanyl-tRNA editing protein [Oscillospiraceae bacterium]|nr:alanyl-tRNA editing protein [Oscillospiraceae bacterium]